MGLQKSGEPIPPEQVVRLRGIIEKKGHGMAARLIGLSEQTLDRAIGGLHLMPGTRALIAAAIADRDREGKVP